MSNADARTLILAGTIVVGAVPVGGTVGWAWVYAAHRDAGARL